MLLRRSWGCRNKRVSEKSSTTGERKHSSLCNVNVPQMEKRNHAPPGLGAAITSHRETMRSQWVPCSPELCQVASLFPPPIKQQRDDPRCCRHPHELQPGLQENKPPQVSPPFFPQRAHTLLPSASVCYSLCSVQPSHLSFRLALFLTSSAPAGC